MSATVARIRPHSADLGRMVDQVDAAIAAVANLGDRESLGTARIALDAAKEMARLHGVARDLRIRLTRLELHIARRAGQLGMTVKGVTPTVAAYYADKTDTEIDALIMRHSGKSAAASIMRAEKALNEFTSARAKAARFEVTGRLEVADAGETLAAIVTAAQDEFYDRDQVGISEVAEYVGELVGVPTYDEDVSVAGLEGLRLGLWDACRKALASGELDDPRLDGLPRWITCLGPDGHRDGDRSYVRVPTAKASLRQLQEYVELIRRKARENLDRAERIDEIRSRLIDAIESASGVDGDASGAFFAESASVGEAAILMLGVNRDGAA